MCKLHSFSHRVRKTKPKGKRVTSALEQHEEDNASTLLFLFMSTSAAKRSHPAARGHEEPEAQWDTHPVCLCVCASVLIECFPVCLPAFRHSTLTGRDRGGREFSQWCSAGFLSVRTLNQCVKSACCRTACRWETSAPRYRLVPVSRSSKRADLSQEKPLRLRPVFEQTCREETFLHRRACD